MTREWRDTGGRSGLAGGGLRQRVAGPASGARGADRRPAHRPARTPRSELPGRALDSTARCRHPSPKPAPSPRASTPPDTTPPPRTVEPTRPLHTDASHSLRLDSRHAHTPQRQNRVFNGRHLPPLRGGARRDVAVRVVLTITKLRGAEYLIASVADGMEDYYMGAGEAPGVWRGTLGRRARPGRRRRGRRAAGAGQRSSTRTAATICWRGIGNARCGRSM